MLLRSLKTSELTYKDIIQICKLKNTHWQYGLKSQLDFFYKYIKPSDIHICIFLKNNLIGYNCLRTRNLFIAKKKSKYLLFDTLIISKNFRKKKIANLIMSFNNIIIRDKKLMAILFCNKKLLKFYSLFGWVKLKKDYLQNYKFSKEVMYFRDLKSNLKNFGQKKVTIFFK
tara:strand:+ start:708 stop:1220 length:513 start_codon:yes stop_codon:yes gene_type:complete